VVPASEASGEAADVSSAADGDGVAVAGESEEPVGEGSSDDERAAS
jgi:hypothetical protein